jgi:protein gp37
MHPDHRKVAKWDGTVLLREKELLKPIARRKPTLFATCLLGDLFHVSVPFEWIDRVFATMATCPQHQFVVLTKRADRMRDYARNERDLTGVAPRGHITWPLKNVWMGVSVSNQRDADERVEMLCQTPAAHRWVSVEPLLGYVSLNAWLDHIEAVIVGCESGPGRRPEKREWISDVQRQCQDAGIPVYVKQYTDATGHLVTQKPPESWPWIVKSKE